MNAPRSVLAIVSSLCLLSGCAAAGAGAYATVAPPPSPSGASGLPDGRVYEEASPPNKHGFQTGALARTSLEGGRVQVEFSVSSPDGNAVAFSSSGPAAETNASGLSWNFVAEHTSHGWVSRSTTGRGIGLNEKLSVFLHAAIWRDYSPDLSHFAYDVNAAEVPGAPLKGYGNYYMLGSNPLEAPTWLLREGEPTPLAEQPASELLGMSPDASVIYIAYPGRMLAQDASRESAAWGLYEYRDGRLREAGVMPDGSVPASGVMPPATAVPDPEGGRLGENNPASLDNQLSEDGRRVLFVSSRELYVHKIEPDGSERTVLVSASQLAAHVGEAAPDGVALFENLTKNASENLTTHAGQSSAKSGPTYAYASPDGSHVFFQSEDQLTSEAPGGGGMKVYDFNVNTGSLEYLPDVALGGIVTAAKDGSSFAFVNGASSPREIDLWSRGPNGGSVTQIAQLPGGGFVGPGRMVASNSELIFQAQAPIAGFNSAGGEQIYRYDIKSNELGCVSCPPAGVSPSGNAYLSAVDQYVDEHGSSIAPQRAVNDARGVSTDGTRIFFGSPDPLVGRDTNGDFDTYEWEDGKVFLISSGSGTDYSPFLDNSESGDDVFFATSDELVEGDTDAGFDVYDARIPRPGDNPPPSAVPCTGDVCQGPPSVAQLLGAPPSATFNGTGNTVEEHAASKVKSVQKRSSGSKNDGGLLHSCRKLKAGHKRTECEKRVRKHHAAKSTTAKRNAGRGK